MAKDKLILEAIALKKCIHVTYNRDSVRLAPHILYTRHGELYIDAVAVMRAGKRLKDHKLGSYKVDGLKGLVLTSQHFGIDPLYDAANPRYDGTALFAA